MKINKGFTLIEILIVIAITIVILTLAIGSFYELVKKQALDKDYLSVASFIDQAKSMSINSKSASQYGVYLASTTAVLFKGSNYIPSNTDNQIYLLNSRVNISSINLSGSSTNQFVFDRTTGFANASGTIAISLINDPASARTIRIYRTGVVEYQ